MFEVFEFIDRVYYLVRLGRLRVGLYSNGNALQVWRTRG
jgi:hypothetical protein